VLPALLGIVWNGTGMDQGTMGQAPMSWLSPQAVILRSLHLGSLRLWFLFRFRKLELRSFWKMKVGIAIALEDGFNLGG
jgi:hypothetical protein